MSPGYHAASLAFMLREERRAKGWSSGTLGPHCCVKSKWKEDTGRNHTWLQCCWGCYCPLCFYDIICFPLCWLLLQPFSTALCWATGELVLPPVGFCFIHLLSVGRVLLCLSQPLLLPFPTFMRHFPCVSEAQGGATQTLLLHSTEKCG